MHFYQLTKAAVLATVAVSQAILLPRSVHDQFLKARQLGPTVTVPAQCEVPCGLLLADCPGQDTACECKSPFRDDLQTCVTCMVPALTPASMKDLQDILDGYQAVCAGDPITVMANAPATTATAKASATA